MSSHDIENRQDIDRLLVRFYETAMVDAVIAHHFTELDLEEHLPIIGDFWEKVLFARPVYFRNPLEVHKVLHEKARLQPEHFERWVEIFRSTVDSMFAGARADLAKVRAGFIADTLSQRLNPSINIKPHDLVSRDDVRQL